MDKAIILKVMFRIFYTFSHRHKMKLDWLVDFCLGRQKKNLHYFVSRKWNNIRRNPESKVKEKAVEFVLAPNVA